MSFQQSRVITCKLPLWFSHSMIILESPNTWRPRIWSWDARDSKAQTPNSSSLVLVPDPQLKVHWKIVWLLILMTPAAPLCRPYNWFAPSNQLAGMSSFNIGGNLLRTIARCKVLDPPSQPHLPLSKVILFRSSHTCQQMRDGSIGQFDFWFIQPSKQEDTERPVQVVLRFKAFKIKVQTCCVKQH